MKTLVLALIALTGISQAQEAVACRFLCFARAKDGTAKLIAAGANGQPLDCPLPLSMPSNPVPLVPKNGSIEFRKAVTDTAPVAVAKVPAGIKSAYVLMLPSEGKEGQIHDVVVIDDSPKGFPKDGCVVLNLYQQNVRFIIGEHQILLPPGKTAPLERPKKIDEFNMSATAFQFQSGEEWRTASESLIRFPEGQRHLFVTYVDPATKRPRLKSFRIEG